MRQLARMQVSAGAEARNWTRSALGGAAVSEADARHSATQVERRQRPPATKRVYALLARPVAAPHLREFFHILER